MKIINILGTNIHKVSKKEVLKKVQEYLKSPKQNYIVTPNPEIILEAQHDEEFFYILNHADLSLPDGIGLKFAAWLLRENLNRITGADLTKEILKLAEEKKYKVGVINWCCGLSTISDIEKVLSRDYPRLNFIVEDIERGEEIKSEGRVGQFKPDIMFVALGAPYQEKAIFHNLKNIPSVKLALGIGGAFDFISGKVKRAPRIIRKIGFEWLWRLVSQPQDRSKRAKRIYNAVIKFPLKVLKWRFIMPWQYRPNVACLLYKREGDRYKILLVERKDEADHWQMPQGGLDGLDIKEAGMKELYEEVGCEKIEFKAVYKKLHQYEFNNGKPRHRGAVYSRHAGYKGQRQNLLIAEYLGTDEEIKINFWDHSAWKWVDSERLVDEVFEVRKEATKVFYDKFQEFIG